MAGRTYRRRAHYGGAHAHLHPSRPRPCHRAPGDRRRLQDCLRSGDGWLHLRICPSAGTSAAATTRPTSTRRRTTKRPATRIIRLLEPHEVWSWCYEDEVLMRIPEVARPDPHPSPRWPAGIDEGRHQDIEVRHGNGDERGRAKGREAMTEDVLTMTPNRSLRDAARFMVEHNVGAAVIVDPEQPGPGHRHGARSRPLAGLGRGPRHRARPRPPHHNAVFADADWGLEDAADAMARGGFRHLVVARPRGGRGDHLDARHHPRVAPALEREAHAAHLDDPLLTRAARGHRDQPPAPRARRRSRCRRLRRARPRCRRPRHRAPRPNAPAIASGSAAAIVAPVIASGRARGPAPPRPGPPQRQEPGGTGASSATIAPPTSRGCRWMSRMSSARRRRPRGCRTRRRDGAHRRRRRART